MEVSDDLYTGPLGPNAFNVSSVANPTRQMGVGPLGRVVFRDITPLALGTANVAVLAAPAANVAMVLLAGTGTTAGKDTAGNAIVILDVPRCVSLTSTSNLSAINFLIRGYDEYGQPMSQLKTGPNNNTVDTLKAFKSVLSVTPTGTNAGTVSVGTSDTFGLNYVVDDAGDIISAKWANTLAQNAGTLVNADATSPATNLTGDVRGTFTPAGAASNGSNILTICIHVDSSQAGPNATRLRALGVTEA